MGTLVELERELKRYVRQIRPGLIGATANANVNLAHVIEELKLKPDKSQIISEKLFEVVRSLDFTSALTETGLTLEAGVFSEVFKRLEYKILPKAVDGNDFLGFCDRIFDATSDSSWLETIDRESFGEFLGLLLADREKITEIIVPQMFLSLEILSLRLAGLGFEPLLVNRLKDKKEYKSAFLNAPKRVQQLVEKSQWKNLDLLDQDLDSCLAALRYIRTRRAEEGASLGLTYQMLKITQVVQRMKQISQLIRALNGPFDSKPALNLFFDLLLANMKQLDLGAFLAKNLQLLAYQITEHTGKLGEHYITRNREEWRAMLRSSMIGGFVVAFMAVLKVLIAKLHLPPVPEGLSFGLLYGLGFVFIQSIGGTLATKQPAMTASHMASSLDQAQSSSQALENLNQQIVSLIRSQLVALMGNFLVAFPVAVLICLPFTYLNASPVTVGKSWTLMQSFHPWLSLSLWYAGIAGICLFISGLIAGFVENWFVFNRVGVRLKQSQIFTSWVPAQRADEKIKSIEINIGPWLGNLSLGFLLGGMGTLGTILGLPLDTRHVTFSSASFGLALASIKFSASWPFILMIGFTILLMGLINLAVSFSLSLFVAMKSRRVKFSQTPELISLLFTHFRTRPWDFIIPPGGLS